MGGKAGLLTKGGLPCYILYTYTLHEVSSFTFLENMLTALKGSQFYFLLSNLHIQDAAKYSTKGGYPRRFYPQSMPFCKTKKKWVYHFIPQYYFIKVGVKGVYISRTCFLEGGTVA